MPTASVSVHNSVDGLALEAIHGKIEPVRTSPGYIAGMSLVALVMVLLPLLYLALICAVAALLWYHATHSVSLFENARGRNLKGALALYVGPFVIGGIVLLFMIKPLFAPRRRDTEPLTLDPEKEPLLFAFVNKLCAAVHAPAPREIRVDSEVNASAGLRHGFWSMFGSDLTLTIGLPLASGMSLRQLSGVLAHEFGHFSQGAGMRLTYVIRSISFWFVRVVYERDAWDEWLTEQAANSEGWYVMVVQLTRGCVWFTRRILWVLMWIGQFVSCFLLRQMEFDADRHEARFAGSETFQETSRRLAELSVARRMAMGDISQFMNEGRLPEDLPALVLANVPQITPEIRKQVLEPLAESKTGLFDTHPADRDRIASAVLEKAPGIFRLPAVPNSATHPATEQRQASAAVAANTETGHEHFDEAGNSLPATVLFRDFAQLSRTATVMFYEEQLERKIKPEELCSVASLVGAQEADLKAAKVLEEYLHGTASPLRPLPLPAKVASPPSNTEEAAQKVTIAREQMLSLLEAYRADFKEFDDADTEHLAASTALAVYRAGAVAFRKKLELKFDDSVAAAAGGERASSTMESAAVRLVAFETAAAERLLAATQMALLPEVRAKAGLDEDAPARIARLLATANLAAAVGPDIVALRNQLTALSSLLSCVKESETSEPLIAAIRQGSREIRDSLIALRGRLAGKTYPFDHAQSDMTLDWYVCGLPPGTELPDADAIGHLASLANDAVNKVFGLHHRVMSHLAVTAAKVEGIS